jgi:hypothetical protein
MHVSVFMENARSAGCHERNERTWHNEREDLANRIDYIAKTAVNLFKSANDG